MEQMLQHANLSETARSFFCDVMRECPKTFRTREMLWQLKLLSRYSAERTFFESALERKKKELESILPIIRIDQVPPPRSTPISRWRSSETNWPNPVDVLTQLFLQQILSSTELFLDLGSRTDAFFLSERRDYIGWVPESSGVRWHEPFRSELARLYLGWAFDQTRLIETALNALHVVPVGPQVLGVLGHWRDPHCFKPILLRGRLLELFRKAENLGIHLHPNIMVWALYELEMVEVLAILDATPNLEQCADELCRLQCRMSA